MLLKAFQVALHFSSLVETFLPARVERFQLLTQSKFTMPVSWDIDRKNDQKFGNSCLLRLTWLSFVFNASVVTDWPKNKTRCFFRLSTISVLTYSRHLSGIQLLCRSNAMLNHLGKHLNTIAFIAAILAGSQRSKNLNHRSFTTDGTWNTEFDSKRFNEVWRSF